MTKDTHCCALLNITFVFVAGGAAMLSLLPRSVQAQGAKKPGSQTSGTTQAKGGDGVVGTTYTFTENGSQLNAKLVGMEYSVGRYSASTSSILVPKAGEKLLILHWLVKNPEPHDQYIGGGSIPFSTVGLDGELRNAPTYERVSTEKHPVQTMLKAGQPLPAELIGGIIIPGGGIEKLIINQGRIGTSDKVTRFPIGKSPNVVKPLPAADADPADSTGATPRKEVPAVIGTAYPMGYFDFTVNSIAFAPGPIGTRSPGDGKRYLVVSVTAVNRAWAHQYDGGIFAAMLTTSDDEKTKKFDLFKGKRDEDGVADLIDPDDSVTFRLGFVFPKDTAGKTLKLAEAVDNTGGLSRALLFDLSGVK